MFNIKTITMEDQQTSVWAGGKTTQLAIYPKEASYGDRTFLWRLSSAVIELEESDFTKLNGFDRHLMLLEGQVRLVHKDRYERVLSLFEQDSFKGDWDTKSYGKAKDFNLMLNSEGKGSLEHYKLLPEVNTQIKLAPKPNCTCFFACYSYNGSSKFVVENQTCGLRAGELLLVEYDEVIQIQAQAAELETCHAIAAFITISK